MHPPRSAPLFGSPPRAWGRRRLRRPSPRRRRFTPTCVGTAPERNRPPQRLPVHPHVRGDGAGGRRQPRRAPRFTPTCVGTAGRLRALGSPNPVHPHVRGDGLPPHCCPWRICGSPPRAWGRHRQGRRDGGLQRFTPTCVGTAQQRVPRSRRSAVHPHVRGDGSPPRASLGSPDGSPPRAWGRRLRSRLCVRCRRFTPTCVGTANGDWQRTARNAVHPHVRGDGPRQ